MMKYEIIADWDLNKFCNFHCIYCFLSSEDRLNKKYMGNEAKEFIDFFEKHEKTWLIHMSGGEPFLHPDFIELCKAFIKKHYISINTNLSTRLVYDFSRQIDPERVSFIHCALHIVERERQASVDDFIKKVKILEQSGFNVYVTQVMWPPVVERFHQIFNFFQKEGILVRPKVFRGNIKGKEYPQYYSKEERDTILDFMRIVDESDRQSGKRTGHLEPNLDAKRLDGYVSFRNRLCSAGVKFVHIDFDGNVKRCHSVPTKLGNVYDGELKLLENAVPCTARICGCAYYGFTFAKGSHKIIKSRLPLFIHKLLQRK